MLRTKKDATKLLWRFIRLFCPGRQSRDLCYCSDEQTVNPWQADAKVKASD